MVLVVPTNPPGDSAGGRDGRRNAFLSPSDIHILVVDDDRLSRAIVTGLLRKCSYTVTTVDSGVEAVEVLKQARPGTYNLVLTDLVMPEVDGLDLLRYIREDERMKTVPVVMMSASERSENVFECIRDGAEDYLFKPLNRKEVQYIWQHVWRRRHTFPQIVPISDDSSSPGSTEVTLAAPFPSSTALVLQPTTTAAAVASVTAHSIHTVESLGSWLAARTMLDVAAAFTVFCRATALLKAHHVLGVPFGRLRPSQLCFAANGTLQLMPSGKAATPVCEQAWYMAPEEEQGAPPSCSGDIFSLGILFVDLFYTVGLPFSARSEVVLRAREGCCPLELLERREEADFVLSVLRPEPADRPTIMDVLYSDTLPRLLDSLTVTWAGRVTGAGPASAHEATSAPPDDQALLDFLTLARTRTLLDSMAAERELCRLEGDIERTKALWSNDKHAALPSPSTLLLRAPHDATSPPPPKRAKLLIAAGNNDERLAVLQRVLPAMEAVYSEQRHSAMQQGDAEHLSRFSERLTHYTRHTTLKPLATMDCGDGRVMHDMVCSVAFDRDDEFFATAGVSRRLKVFDFKSVLEASSSIHYPVLELNTRSKLSCVAWNPYVKSHVAASDYDGTIQLWDAGTKAEVMQFEEHTRRVWSIHFCPTDPMRMVSGSDDHGIKLWALNCEASRMTLDAKANVCSVQFHPSDCNLVACGAANYRVYLFDLRQPTAPLAVLGNHGRSVSYVRYVDADHLVSASTDSALRLWGLKGVQGTQQHPSMIFKGHSNEKNFVGLSVSRGGYVATGSEDNSVVAYSRHMPMPLANHSFAEGEAAAGLSGSNGTCHFVSSVTWSGSGRYLAAANSMGRLRMLELV